jgi:hypothetical protein
MLKAASIGFVNDVKVGEPTFNYAGAKVEKIFGPLKTTITLLEDGDLRICLLTTPFPTPENKFSDEIRQVMVDELKIPKSHALVFTSHDHCVPILHKSTKEKTALGKKFMSDIRGTLKKLPKKLQPVTIWYGQGTEDRITYNRKGRRADGTTYLMREEDRKLVGRDFRGDIDSDAPVICLKGEDGKPVAFLVQFTGHPVTSYAPEHSTVFGEYPQVASDLLSEYFSDNSGIPVNFFQGCAGDVNAKEMMTGGVKRSEQFGRCLGNTYIKTAKKLTQSKQNSLAYEMAKVPVPLTPLPSPRVLQKELNEINDFIKRAENGDKNTLECIGFNFPKNLSPAYRANLMKAVVPWSKWALNLHRKGKAHTVPKHRMLEVYVLRLGDVGIVGIQAEAFSGIGRLMKKNSPMPLTIPCAYANSSSGYITDGPNTGDREYMSSHYRYTRYFPQLKKPAGDVLANKAVQILKKLSRK